MTYNAEQITFMLHEAIDENREYKSWHCSTQHLMTLVERVVAEEREACADIAENWNSNGMPRTGVANEIRARGQA
jgi:hypothetical protein